MILINLAQTQNTGCFNVFIVDLSLTIKVDVKTGLNLSDSGYTSW